MPYKINALIIIIIIIIITVILVNTALHLHNKPTFRVSLPMRYIISACNVTEAVFKIIVNKAKLR